MTRHRTRMVGRVQPRAPCRLNHAVPLRPTPTHAGSHSTAALDLSSDNVRACALHQILLARVQTGLGEIEQSCDTAKATLQATARVDSRWLRDRIHEYDTGLTPHAELAL